MISESQNMLTAFQVLKKQLYLINGSVGKFFGIAIDEGKEQVAETLCKTTGEAVGRTTAEEQQQIIVGVTIGFQ